jgi:two-component system, chemotaxis family, sensor kinase CheA
VAQRDPYRYFRIEARELLDQLTAGTLELEKRNTPELIGSLLRQAHTLKGAARVVRQKDIADQAHKIEDVLTPARTSGAPLSATEVSTILQLLDAANVALAGLGEAQPTAGAADPPAAAAPAALPLPFTLSVEARRTLRTEVADLDQLQSDVHEALAQADGLQHSLAELHEAAQLAGSAELRGRLDNLERSLSRGLEALARELAGVRETSDRLRLVALNSLFPVLERTARDAAQETGREVHFAGSGGDIRLDADLVRAVQGALVQCVRNSVAHGIERPDERVAAGKAPAGRIELRISRTGQRVLFACQDDGRGLDLAKLRRAAESRGLGRDLPEAQLVDLVLRGGVSTAEEVTGVSGRGVGLDVVREAAERLGGKLSLRWQSGRSTTVEIDIPVSLASMDALTVEAGGTLALIPLELARSALRFESRDLVQTPTGQTLLHNGEALPYFELAQLFGRRASAEVVRSAVLLQAERGVLALGVDHVREVSRSVVRPLPPLAPCSAAVSGAVLDSAGDPLLVLEPEGLAGEARTSAAAVEASGNSARLPLLVIDDSLTSRMLQQTILESAGYEVEVASSGEQALEMAARKLYALFVVDVEMPGIDGFTFIERIRQDARLAGVPALLVTSLGSAEHKRRGMAAGAQGYIVKSEFDQNELLRQIRELVGG